MMPKVYVCFLRADSELLEKHILNSAAAWFAPQTHEGHPMVHAEVFFPFQDDRTSVIGKSCGIHYGGQVFVREKRFTKKNWVFRALTCTREQYNNMFNFCKNQRGGEFNYMGYFTPCGISMESRINSTNPQRWYCSELSSAILHAGEIIDCVSDNTFYAHPQLLYDKVVPITFADCGRNIDQAAIQI